MIHEKSCGAVVFTREHGIREFVIVKSNYYGLPKGHVENGETEQETALREIKEETGIDAKIIPGFRETVNYRLPNGRSKEVVFFVAEYENQKIIVNRRELKKILVLPFNRAVNRLTYADTRAVMADADSWIEKQRQQ